MTKAKLLYIGLVVLLLVPAFYAKDKVIQSKWAPVVPKIDGSNAEWAEDILEVDKTNGVSYAFKNTANHIFLLFAFNDPKTLGTLNQTGLTIWVNLEGKEKKVHGLRFYQKKVNPDQLIAELEKQGQTLDEQKKQDIKAKGGTFMLYACDARNKKGETIPHPANTGVATYRVGQIGKTPAYEMVIPIEMLVDPATNAKVDLSNPLKIGFEWGGPTEEQLKTRAGQIGDSGAAAGVSGGSLESYMGGGEGGGGFNAPSASLSGMRRGLPKKYDFWVTVQFANVQQ